MIKIVYFASLKERIGRAQDQIELPEGAQNVGELIDLLAPQFGEAWSEQINGSTTLIAVNQEMTDRAAPIKDGDEIAFFPPVTGG